LDDNKDDGLRGRTVPRNTAKNVVNCLRLISLYFLPLKIPIRNRNKYDFITDLSYGY
jgi:hypothetical protein